MQRLITIGGVLIIIFALIWWKAGNDMPSSSASIDYRGHSIKLSKPYADYEDYQSDPDNLAPDDVAKAQELVKSAPIATQFSDREAMARAVFDLKFPGYGLGAYGEKPQSDGSVLALFSVEIPKSGSTRYLLFRGNGGMYRLIDDFVYDNGAAIANVSSNGDHLIYSTIRGAKVVERSQPAN